MSSPLSVVVSSAELVELERFASSRAGALVVSLRAGLACVYDGAPFKPRAAPLDGVLVSVELPAALALELERLTRSTGAPCADVARGLLDASTPVRAPVAPLPFEGSIFRPSWARG